MPLYGFYIHANFIVKLQIKAHPLNVVAVVGEKDVDSFEEKIVVCFLKPNQMHPLNVVAVVDEKDVDFRRKKNRSYVS